MSKKKIQLIFECCCDQTCWGETLRVVGNTRELGLWNVVNGVLLSTSNAAYPRWRSNTVTFLMNSDELPPAIEFKFVICKEDGLGARWEQMRK